MPQSTSSRSEKLTVRLTPEDIQRIQRLADAQGIPVRTLAAQLLQAAIAAMEANLREGPGPSGEPAEGPQGDEEVSIHSALQQAENVDHIEVNDTPLKAAEPEEAETTAESKEDGYVAETRDDSALTQTAPEAASEQPPPIPFFPPDPPEPDLEASGNTPPQIPLFLPDPPEAEADAEEEEAEDAGTDPIFVPDLPEEEPDLPITPARSLMERIAAERRSFRRANPLPLYPPDDFLPVTYSMNGRPLVKGEPLEAMSALQVWRNRRIVWANAAPFADSGMREWMLLLPEEDLFVPLTDGTLVRPVDRRTLTFFPVIFRGGEPYAGRCIPLRDRIVLVPPLTGSHVMAGRVQQNLFGKWQISLGGRKSLPLSPDMQVAVPDSL